MAQFTEYNKNVSQSSLGNVGVLSSTNMQWQVVRLFHTFIYLFIVAVPV